jgi:segregation and condensation protein B
MNDTPEQEEQDVQEAEAAVQEVTVQEELPVANVDADPAAMTRLEHILEALLLAADQPLSMEQLTRLLGADLGVGKKELRSALDQLGNRIGSGASELREVSSGFRIQVKADYAEWVGRLWQEKPPRYSRALLETLALVCYRQPITRGEVEDVRGVAVSSNILRTLLERGWIRELGVKEVPGRPALFGTTQQFLDDFGLRSLDDLPALPEIKDLEQLDAALARLAEQAGAIGAAEAGDDAPPAEEAAEAEAPVAAAADESEVVEGGEAVPEEEVEALQGAPVSEANAPLPDDEPPAKPADE